MPFADYFAHCFLSYNSFVGMTRLVFEVTGGRREEPLARRPLLALQVGPPSFQVLVAQIKITLRLTLKGTLSPQGGGSDSGVGAWGEIFSYSSVLHLRVRVRESRKKKWSFLV